ncbi:hypothetical protein GCM10009001_15860 [Virgibacillus siamensis]|uniref:DUF4083 domain-containing protein n=1 Tax=Virgibacillus siamensis TaxID=480071 RepID=A0ABN1FY61_9BACI
METLFVILIFLLILGLCFLLMYWGVREIYKIISHSKYNNDKELIKEIYSLKQRVDSLERKLNNK